MSIPYWREVKYTDDGCSIYECLNCYSGWESRSAPWWSEDGKKPVGRKGVWNFCPVCGIEWSGQIRPKEKEYFPHYRVYGTTDRLYPCKFRIISTYTDGDYVSKDIEFSGCKDPAWAVKKLKELREQNNDKLFGVVITYHIEKESA